MKNSAFTSKKKGLFSVQRSVIAQRVPMLKPLMREACNETEAGEISKE